MLDDHQRERPGCETGARAIHRQEDPSPTLQRYRRQFAYQVDAEHFRTRVVQDVLAEALAVYWDRRAAALEAALPRPDDFVGRSTAEERRERTQRLQEAIAACRLHARLVCDGRPYAADVTAVLQEAE
jgi:hypothetical protein